MQLQESSCANGKDLYRGLNVAFLTFVTDGVESAIEQANAIACYKHVVVASTTIVQQRLKAGPLEEIHIDLVPILLGAGIRLFDHLDSTIELERTKVIESTGVTHLTFSIVK